jgi:hypothetical protein
MCVKRIEEAEELFCFKIIYEGGTEPVYYVDTSMADAVRSAEDICAVKTAEFIGVGAIGC